MGTRAVIIITGYDANNEVRNDQNCKSGLTKGYFPVPALVPREHLMEGKKDSFMKPYCGGLRAFRV